MSTPFDLTTISLVTSGGIELEDETESEPNGMVFSPDGTRLWFLITKQTQQMLLKFHLM